MLNFKSLIASLDDAMNATAERDALVAELTTRTFNSKAHLFAVICTIFETQGISPAPKDTPWDDLSQPQRDLVTVYSQSGRALGFEFKS